MKTVKRADNYESHLLFEELRIAINIGGGKTDMEHTCLALVGS